MVQQHPWFKLMAWFLATFFFFMASSLIISLLKPGPSEIDVMRFMGGMMNAMENSIMGVSMGVENNTNLQQILGISYFMIAPTIAISIIAGLAIRFICRSGRNVR